MNPTKRRMLRAFAVCAVIAIGVVGLSLLFEDAPRLTSVGMWHDFESREWHVTGQVEFPRRGRVFVFGWSEFALTRTAPFSLTVQGGGHKLTRDMYAARAIEAARLAPGKWSLVAGWGAVVTAFWVLWYVLRYRPTRTT